MSVEADLVDRAQGTDLIVVEAAKNAVALFTDGKQYDEFFEKVKQSVSGFVPDVTTDKGRREIASVAFRVTKAKTTLDKAGLALTEEWRQKTAAVNASRKRMTAELDALAAEVRRPLTEWEQEEESRLEIVEERLQRLRNAVLVTEFMTAADVEQRLEQLRAIEFGEDLFRERMAEAKDTRDLSVQSLERTLARLRQEEADRAELERLRREAAEREERDRLEAEVRERAAAAEREAREREERERRIREEEEQAFLRAEREKEEAIAAAEERARIEAEERVRAAERAEAEEREARERARAEEAEREAEELRRREEERLAWEAREKREREQREADERHRKAVVDETAADIDTVTGGQFGLVVATAIAAGTIRHVKVEF